MTTEADPILENWYQHLDKGRKFEVINIDDDNNTVEVQYFDGDVDEISFEAWYEMELEPIEAPEDWTGSADIVEPDDLGYTETDMEPTDWTAPHAELRRPQPAEESETEVRWEEEESGESE